MCAAKRAAHDACVHDNSNKANKRWHQERQCSPSRLSREADVQAGQHSRPEGLRVLPRDPLQQLVVLSETARTPPLPLAVALRIDAATVGTFRVRHAHLGWSHGTEKVVARSEWSTADAERDAACHLPDGHEPRHVGLSGARLRWHPHRRRTLPFMWPP